MEKEKNYGDCSVYEYGSLVTAKFSTSLPTLQK